MKNSELKKIMSKASQVVKRNPVLPILEYALIDRNNRLIVTDLEVTLIQYLDDLMDTPVTTLVPFDTLKKIVTKLPAKAEVKLKAVSDERLIVNIDGEDKFDLSIDQKYEDFPSTPESTDAMDRFPCPQMHRALGYVTKDELRPAMTGVFIGEEHIVATDGHRLLFIKHDKQVSEETVVPAPAVKLLPKTGDVTVHNTTNKYNKAFHCDGGDTIIFHVIEGRFPDYRSVIPTGEMLKTKFTVKSDELKQETEMALLVANADTKKVMLDLNGECHIKSKDLDYDNKFSAQLKTGTYESSEHDQLRIGFNAQYLLDAIKDISVSTMVMEIRNPSTGVIINDEILLMPVLLST